MDLSSWAERNKAHRDAERLEVVNMRRKNNSKGAPLELEPLAKPAARGRENAPNSEFGRSLSVSPTARQAGGGESATKRAQYEQANQEYMQLMKKEKARKEKKTSSPRRSGRLPSLPLMRDSPRGDEPPSARTPPPNGSNAPTSVRASSRHIPDDGPLATRSAGLPGAFVVSPADREAAAENEGSTGYLSGDEDAAKDNAKRAKPTPNRIRVIVRKRPINQKEGGEDVVECTAKSLHVCATKLRVDLTEYQESHQYEFDDACSHTHTNRDVYDRCGRDLITTVFEGGSASCFAYGQTGSGKTHTMIGNDDEPGIYVLAAEDIFARCQPNHRIFVSLYEIYCNSLFDLLNQRQALQPREDANRRINICGLTWHEIRSVKDLLRVIDRGTLQRRTGSTSANEFSSRSHAVMTISLRDEDQPKFVGSLNVVDLAGSERAADTAANDKQTRLEGAEINKSLLALKECIRGLDEGKRHIQFRGSKLTEVLRDSFVGNSRTAMIATVSPSSTNVEHTLNTLRYAFRVKGLSIDCPMPSKERNAPRPTQRSKSTDVELANRRIERQKEKEEANKERKKRSHKRRTPRRATAENGGNIDRLVEERLTAAMGLMKDQLLERERQHAEEQRRQAEEQKKQAEMITALTDQVRMLNQQLMAGNSNRPPRNLPPLDAGPIENAAEIGRPRSERASRRSRRKPSHQTSARASPIKGEQGASGSFTNGQLAPLSGPTANQRPISSNTNNGGGGEGAKARTGEIEEVVTLDELAS